MIEEQENLMLRLMGDTGYSRQHIIDGNYPDAAFDVHPELETMRNPLPPANTTEGIKQIERMMQERILATRRAQNMARRVDIEENAKRAPLYNTQNNFDSVFEDGRVFLEDDNGNTFDAYVIQSPESDFFGMPVPILDDSTDIERSQNLLDNAYYNPVAGKVIVPVFPQGVSNGDRPTRAQFEELERMTDNAFPGLLETREDKMNVLRKVLVRAGYATN